MPRIQITSLVVTTLIAGGSGALAQDAAQPQIPAVMQAPLEKSHAAIAECREKRLRGEISSYAESARCSDRIIFMAWKEANYPEMDLITEWINAREAASEKVDQKIITPQEFERQMGELTVRLTAEERRRRAGLIYSADNALQLELPPSTQVLGVATPKSEQKLAAKKSNAARERAANGVFPDPSQATTVGSLGSLSQLDSAKPSRAPTRAAAPGEGSDGLYALLAAQQKEIDARAIYRMLQEKYPDTLGKRDAVIRRADAGDKGTYYRVEVGPLSPGQADELCGTLKQGGTQCAPHYE
jgi:hypothetical protein